MASPGDLKKKEDEVERLRREILLLEKKLKVAKAEVDEMKKSKINKVCLAHCFCQYQFLILSSQVAHQPYDN
jgi:phage terminase Nu1 subunit (DNA packaging protein)